MGGVDLHLSPKKPTSVSPRSPLPPHVSPWMDMVRFGFLSYIHSGGVRTQSVQDGGAGLGALILCRFQHEHLANIDSFGYTSQLLCSQEPGSPTSR